MLPQVVLLTGGHLTLVVDRRAGQEDPLALVGLLHPLLQEAVVSPRIQLLLLLLLFG